MYFTKMKRRKILSGGDVDPWDVRTRSWAYRSAHKSFLVPRTGGQ